MLTLRRVRVWTLVLMLLSAGTIIGATAPAQAAPEVDCPGGWTETIKQEDGSNWIITRCPGAEGDNPGAGGGGDGGESAEPIANRECTYGPAITVDCQTRAGTWNGTCYVKIADPQPGKDHPVWGDHEDGVIIQCTAHNASFAEDCDADGGCPAGVSLRWAAGPPDEGPSPAELARRAVAQMQLAMGEIGSTPPEGTTSSLVGMPIWLWVANPAPNTVGPLTVSVTEDGLTVTATATLDRIDYTMRDGGVTIADVTCAGASAPGTPYEATFDDSPSPNCGVTAAQNQQVGAYTITGTASWTVEWSGGGQTGTIPVDVDNSIHMEVGEAQIIRVG